MREHGTRACFVFGPEPGDDRSKGCRCEPCRLANAAYARERYRKAHRPDETLDPAYVDNAEARRHLAWLRDQGVGLRTVAIRSGVGRTALHKIATGRVTRSRPETIDAILAVGRSAVRGAALVDAGPTWRRIDDLLAHGWTRTAIAAALGQQGNPPSLQLGRERVTAANAHAVEELHRTALLAVLRDRELAAGRRRRYRQAA